MTRKDVLAAAEKCVCGDREQDYGSPENNFYTIAKLWSAYLHSVFTRANQVGLTSRDVAAMLALLKIARIGSGHAKADNWVDGCGYLACGGELEGGE